MDTASFLKKMKEPAVVVAQKSFHLTVYEARLTGIADIICESGRVLTNLSWLKRGSKEAKIKELRGKEAEFVDETSQAYPVTRCSHYIPKSNNLSHK